MKKLLRKILTRKGRKIIKKNFGFTLAEVLITLAIIGVVAAITLPNVIANINERTNSERQANIAYKITQAMEQMRAHGELDGSYKSTDEFVDVLQKYLKIAKRCDANNIASCWPTAKVTDGDGEEVDISKIKTGLNLNLPNNKTSNVGLVLADGASLILSYDTNSKGIDVGDEVRASKESLPVGNGKRKDFAYTTSVTSSIDFVMDVNGKKGPNSEATEQKSYDIRSFKAARFKRCPGVKIGEYCALNIGTSYDCIDNNCWKGAVRGCSSIGMTLLNGQVSNIETAVIWNSTYPTSGRYWVSYREGQTISYNPNGGVGSPLDQHHKAMCVSKN